MPRTGTRSVSDAVRLLGFSVSHGIKYLDHDMKQECKRRRMIGNPWLPVYDHYDYVGNVSIVTWRELADSCPDMKFILTVRPLQDWWLSCRNNWEIPLRTQAETFVTGSDFDKRWTLITLLILFGCYVPHETKWKRGYIRHNREVLKYFKGSNRLLVMNIFKGHSWSRLAKFLSIQTIPDTPFPHRRKG
jgi:hypothetical protein